MNKSKQTFLMHVGVVIAILSVSSGFAYGIWWNQSRLIGCHLTPIKDNKSSKASSKELYVYKAATTESLATTEADRRIGRSAFNNILRY